MTPISSVPVLQRKNHGHFNVDKILIINNFHDFFASFFLSTLDPDLLPTADPDLGEKMNMDPNPQSMYYN